MTEKPRHCPNYWIQADNAAKMWPALRRIANPSKIIMLDFGPSCEYLEAKTIDTFPDGSVLIVHKNGFREIFHPVIKIFCETA